MASPPPQAVDLLQRALEDGVDLLSDLELVTIVLAGDSANGAAAADAVSEPWAVGDLARTGIGELAERPAIGRAHAARLAAAVELGRRAIQAASLGAVRTLASHPAVAAWARARLGSLDHEELWVLALDGCHGLRAARRVASGGIHGLHVGVRDVLRVGLREAASSLVLVHNHPSGTP